MFSKYASMKFSFQFKHFFMQMHFENVVCKMVAILSRTLYVSLLTSLCHSKLGNHMLLFYFPQWHFVIKLLGDKDHCKNEIIFITTCYQINFYSIQNRQCTEQNISVMWHEHNGISNHWQLDCLFTSPFRVSATETSKFCITGALWQESTNDWWIPITKGQ